MLRYPIFNQSYKSRLISFIVIFALSVSASIASAEVRPGASAVATAHPLATDAANEILTQGGNAFDAAVAVAATLAVVEPYSSGLGGGGFWLLHRAADDKEIMIDAREKAPLAAHAKLYLDDDGQVIKDASINGPLAAGIPGVPAGLVHLAEHYGRLKLRQSLAAAIRIARGGFESDAIYQKMATLRLEALRASKDAAAIFLKDNKAPDIGSRIIQSELAETLELLADEGAAGFYHGPLAKKLVNGVRSAGGIWSEADLAQYRVVERQPIRIRYRNAEIVSATLPSSGGIVLAVIFNTLTQLSEGKAETDSVLNIHYIIEAMRRAYHDRAKYLGDTDFVKVPVDRLLSASYASELAKTISPERATPSSELSKIGSDSPESDQTTHYSIIDSEGNRVAATLSINYGFGSGFVAPGTGVLLNDEMDDFVAKPGVPNLYGLVGSTANEIASAKRMLSSMSPTFVDDGKRLAILGTPGGSRIITMVLLGIMSFLEGMSASEIVSARRYHHQYLPDQVSFESGAFPVSMQRALTALGHHLEPYDGTYGNMQIVIWDYQQNKLDAASDPRGIGSSSNHRLSRR